LQTGELERLKEFGLTKAIIGKKANKMFKGQEIINKKGQIVDQEKFNKAMMKLMNDKFKGGAEKLAGTTKGMWSTITGVAKTSLAKIMGMQEDGTIKTGSLLDTVKKKVKQVADKFQEWQKDGTIEKIANKATEVFNTVFDVIAKVFNFLKDNKKIIENIAIAFASFYVAIKIVRTLKTVLLGAQIAMALLNGTMLLSPLAWLVIAIAAVIAVGVLLWKNWDVIKVKMNDFTFGMRAAFSNIGTFVGNIFKTMANGFIDSLNFMIRAVNKLPKVDIDIVEKYELGTYKSLTKTGEAAASYKAAKSETHTQMIGQYASGTPYSPAGLALIHEKGGEIRKLSSGETIIPADKSKRLIDKTSGGNNFIINFNGNVGEDEFFDRAGNRIVGQIKSALDNM